MGSAKIQSAQDTQMMNSQNKIKLIPARTSPGNTKSASPIHHQGNDDNSFHIQYEKAKFDSIIKISNNSKKLNDNISENLNNY